MKKVYLLFVLLLPALGNSAFAQKQLKSFDALMDALNGGSPVRMTIYYGECRMEVDGKMEEKGIDAVGGMPVSVYEYFDKGVVYNKKAFVVASTSKLIANPLGKGFVYNYAKLKVYDDGEVQLLAEYVNPLTFEKEMSETFFTTLNDGKSGACYLFKGK